MKQVKNNTEEPDGQFPIIAIGGSAGGMEALIELLHHLPSDTGMAYVYIQHLDPNHESNLVPIIQRETKLEVSEAQEGTRVRPDHLYVIPPKKEVGIKEGMLTLTTRPDKPYYHLPVNLFFTSLAENHKGLPVGIVLSGTANDGTEGLKAIKLAGGITFAQDGTAKFGSMPNSAIAEGAADIILAPDQIAEELVQLSRRKDAYLKAMTDLETESQQSEDPDEDLNNILYLMQRSTGVDFTQYKMKTIKRRTFRRMVMHKLGGLKEYAQFLKQNTAEVSQLYQDLLINVTTFFRDPESTAYLRNTLLPQVIQKKVPNDPIRIWVPACSTGQEAYSLAMIVIECLGDRAASTPVQIFATDLSENAISKARLGMYTTAEVADVPPKTLLRFFTKLEASYRIIKSIRDLCVFANHNVAKDPPFSRLDIISCCNLMIYLDLVLQKKLLSSFHYSLNPDGYLVLGKSESIGTSGYLFNQVDKKLKIYSKKKDATPKALFELNYRNLDRDVNLSSNSTRPVKMKAAEMDLDHAVDELLLKKFTPAAVVVNFDLDILQFRGATGLFLEPSPGKASLNLLKMAKQSLAFELRSIVHKARRNGETVRKNDVIVSTGEKSQKINIEATPVNAEGAHACFLVVFEESVTPPQELLGNVRDRRVQQLEAELSTLRDDMRSIVESQEAANEELQSANEEIVSSNEELQSINEELETSKEEIESSNEELATINQELLIRNEQLAEVEEYSEIVFSTLQECLLVLDGNLHVKRVNDAFYKTFRVTEDETLGIYLYHLGNGQWDIKELRRLLEEVIPNNQQVLNYEVRHVFQHIGEKIMKVNARRLVQKNSRQQLILMAIQDVTEYTKAQQVLAEREAWLRNMANNVPVMIWVTGIDKLCTFVNQTYLDYIGTRLEDAVGKSWTEAVHPDDLGHCLKSYEESFRVKKPFELSYRLRKHIGEYNKVLTRARPNFIEEKFAGYIGSSVELPSGQD